jgi:hypothetical protein
MTAKSPITSKNVTERINLGVTHVQVPRRVGEHVENVLVWTVVWFVRYIERAFRLPHGSPFRL